MNENIYSNRLSVLLDRDNQSSETVCANQVEFEVMAKNNFAHQRLQDKVLWSRYALIGLLFIILVIVIASISIGLSLKASNAEEDAADYSNSLIITSNSAILVFDIETEKLTRLKEVNSAVRAIDVDGSGSIFWSENHVPTFKSLSNNYKEVKHTKKWNPEAIAIDHITNKLYILDKPSGTLNVIDLESGYYNVIFSHLDHPYDIVLDLKEGLMFILQSNSILRSQMDGIGLKKIINVKGVSSLTLDNIEKRLFFIQDFSYLESCDYTGSNCITLTDLPHTFKSLSFLNKYLYWITNTPEDHRSILNSCKISNGQCEDHKEHLLALEKLDIVKSVTNPVKMDNPCKQTDCKHICLLSLNGSTSCACMLGYRLHRDLRSCQSISHFIIFESENFIKTLILNNTRGDAFTDALIPTEVTTDPLLYKDTIDFDYTLDNDLIFSDDNKLYKINLKSEEEQKTVYTAEVGYHIKDLAIDWYTKNIYFSNRVESSSKKHLIKLLKTRESRNILKNVISYEYNNSLILEKCPYSLVAHPQKGYLYYAYWDGVNDFHRMNLDGKHIINNHKIFYIMKYKLLAVDYDTNEIFCLHGRSTSSASSSHFLNLNLTEISDPVFYEIIIDPRSLVVFKNHLYISNLTEIWRCDKQPVANCLKIFPKFDHASSRKISGIKIYSPRIQSPLDENLCDESHNNGGCDQFCFAKPEKSCGCEDGKRLTSNNNCII